MHVYIYIFICRCMHTQTHTSIYCNGSVKRMRCVCVWVYMRFVLRTQAWQCIDDKILEGTKHTHTLPLSLERNKNLYRTLYDCVVCVHRAEFLLSFLSLSPSSPSLSLFSLLSIWQQQKMKRRSTIFCLLFGWLIFFCFASSFSPHFIVTCLLFFLILPTWFVDKRPRKGTGHPIEEKKQVIFSCKWVCFFVLHQRVTHNTVFFHYYCLRVSPSLFPLPVLVCKSPSSFTRTHTHNQKQHYSRCIVNNIILKYVLTAWQEIKRYYLLFTSYFCFVTHLRRIIIRRQA